MKTTLQHFIDNKDYLPEPLKKNNNLSFLCKALDQYYVHNKKHMASYLNADTSILSIKQVVLPFFAYHGYCLQQSKAKLPFADLEANINEAKRRSLSESCIFGVEEEQYRILRNYSLSSKIYPDFLIDHHNQKDIFKSMFDFYKAHNMKKKEDIIENTGWIKIHCNTVDKILPALSFFGYKLQKSRRNLSFYRFKDIIDKRKEQEISILLNGLNKKGT